MTGEVLDLNVDLSVQVDRKDLARFSYDSGNSATAITIKNSVAFPLAVGQTYTAKLINETSHPTFNRICASCGAQAGLTFDAQVELKFNRTQKNNVDVIIIVSTACCGTYGADPIVKTSNLSIALRRPGVMPWRDLLLGE